MEMGGHRKIGRPKLRWSDVTRKRLGEHVWRLKTRCADSHREKAEEEEVDSKFLRSHVSEMICSFLKAHFH